MDERSEWDGYINGLNFAGNLKTRVARGDEGSRVLNDIRDQIDAEVERVKSKRPECFGCGEPVAAKEGAATLDQRAAECMRYYDHAKLARMYVSMIRDFCDMQTAVCRIMQESPDPATVKIARDAFMHIPPKQ